MRIRFPEHDFDGYWMMGGIRGDGPYQAIVLGFSIGVNDGYDWGFIDVKPDPNFCLYAINLVGREEQVGYVEQPIHRHLFTYDRSRLDVRLGERFHVRGQWPKMQYFMASPDGRIKVELEGEMGIAKWSHDMVLRGTSWVTVAMPDFSFEGVATVDGVDLPIEGVGTLDHPMGRLFKSEASPGMGWWEYNCLMLNDEFGLYQWKIVDGEGQILSSDAVTNFPDHEYHSGVLELDYTDWEDRSTIQVPRAWATRITADHGTFEMTVRAQGQKNNGVPHRVGDPLPNFLLEVEGQFTPRDGPALDVTGKGTGETVISEWNPATNTPHRPW